MESWAVHLVPQHCSFLQRLHRHQSSSPLVNRGLPIMNLADLVSRFTSQYNLNEYELWRLIAGGFPSFFKYKKPGMVADRDMVVQLQRASAIEGVWILDGKPIPMAEWL